MATRKSSPSTFGTGRDMPQHPDRVIEETLNGNYFMAAVAGQIYTNDPSSTWESVPRVATTAFTVPIEPNPSGFHDFHESGYGTDSRYTSLGATTASSATSFNFDSLVLPSAPNLVPGARSDYIAHEGSPNQNPDRKDLVKAPSHGTHVLKQQLPSSFVSQQVPSNPAAYLLKHNSGDGGVILTSDGDMTPCHHAQRQSYFEAKPVLLPRVSHDKFRGIPVNINSYPRYLNGYRYSLQPPNPVEGIAGHMPILKDEIIPTYDIGSYPDILHLPSRPSDVLVYFNSICGAVALSTDRMRWIEDNTWETWVRLCNLDDSIFQMYEALSGKQLRGPEGDTVYPSVMEEINGKMVPIKLYFNSWIREIQECKMHLERLNKLAYRPVMNKEKVDRVWEAMVRYKDNWANAIFGHCQYDLWEASMEEMEWMKEYHAFSREMQRLINGVDEDLIEIGRLENLVTAFRAAVWKADMKLKKVKEVFGPALNI